MDYSYILWGNEKFDFYYLPILKNAQTWGKVFFEKNFNFEYLYNKNIPTIVNERNVIVFYREPLTRWFTGAAQWFAGKKVIPGYIIDEDFMDLIFTTGELDHHTKPQKLAFDTLPYENCIFFDVDDQNFFNNLKHYLENVKKLELLYTDIPKINAIEENLRKVNIQAQLINAYNNKEKYRQLLDNYLRDELTDYNMLKENNMFYKVQHD